MRPRIKSFPASIPSRPSPARQKSSKCSRPGFTLIELLLTIAIVGTLLAAAVPNYITALNKSRTRQSISDIAINGIKLEDNLIDFGYLPDTLEEAGCNELKDPWGQPYQYLIILGKEKSDVQGKWRKDRFMVPINSDFDLYSCGINGESIAPLTAKASLDDIIRANNGDYVGLASKY